MFFRRAKEPKGPARSGLPCGKARDLSRRERCFFSLLALAGFALQVSYWVYLRGHLFANISHYRCSFMTERTKGPAVSMRRPPTRGPQDPWTPRTVSLRVHLFAPLPRRPTLDGPAHKVHLHSLYVCSSAGNLAPRCAAHAAKIGLTGLPAPLTPRTPLTPRPAMSVAFFFIGPATPLAPLTFRATSHPPAPRTLLFSLLA